MRRYALDYLRPSQQRFLAPRSLVVLRFAVCSRKSLPTDAPDGPDFPPPPPPLLFCHDWIPGVALRGTLAQTDRPYGKGLGWAMPASISCSCLWLLVASNSPHKGLSPSVIHPCPTHLGSLALASVRHAPAIYRRNVALTPELECDSKRARHAGRRDVLSTPAGAFRAGLSFTAATRTRSERDRADGDPCDPSSDCWPFCSR